MARILKILFLLVFLSGCNTLTTPYIAYDSDKHPLSDTSVFSTIQKKGNFRGALIIGIDGKDMNCALGCSPWVRVLPGDHTFKVKLNVYAGYMMPYRTGKAELTVKDMKPRHVYEAKFLVEEEKFKVSYIDLGEDPEYGITLGLEGFNEKLYRVKFQ